MRFGFLWNEFAKNCQILMEKREKSGFFANFFENSSSYANRWRSCVLVLQREKSKKRFDGCRIIRLLRSRNPLAFVRRSDGFVIHKDVCLMYTVWACRTVISFSVCFIGGCRRGWLTSTL